MTSLGLFQVLRILGHFPVEFQENGAKPSFFYGFVNVIMLFFYAIAIYYGNVTNSIDKDAYAGIFWCLCLATYLAQLTVLISPIWNRKTLAKLFDNINEIDFLLNKLPLPVKRKRHHWWTIGLFIYLIIQIIMNVILEIIYPVWSRGKWVAYASYQICIFQISSSFLSLQYILSVLKSRVEIVNDYLRDYRDDLKLSAVKVGISNTLRALRSICLTYIPYTFMYNWK